MSPRVVGVCIGFTLGALAGVGTTIWFVAKPLAERVDDLALQVWHDKSYALYRFADYEVAQCGLTLYIERVQVRLGETDGSARRDLLPRIALSYARLAAAAERSGRPKAKRELLDLAEAAYREAGERPHQDDILALVAESDKILERAIAQCATQSTAVDESRR